MKLFFNYQNNVIQAICIICIFGCTTTSSVRNYPNYDAPPRTVHSVYPIQFSGEPKTPNERVQVNSRGEYKEPTFSCIAGNVSVTIVGNMVQYKSMDKKKWPDFGYLTKDIDITKAADGTNNYEAIISVEQVDYMKRNDEINNYGNQYYKLNWNDELHDDKWMHGSINYRGFIAYKNQEILYTQSANKTWKIRCTILDPETSDTITKAMAFHTMSEIQKENINPRQE